MENYYNKLVKASSKYTPEYYCVSTENFILYRETKTQTKLCLINKTLKTIQMTTDAFKYSLFRKIKIFNQLYVSDNMDKVKHKIYVCSVQMLMYYNETLNSKLKFNHIAMIHDDTFPLDKIKCDFSIITKTKSCFNENYFIKKDGVINKVNTFDKQFRFIRYDDNTVLDLYGLTNFKIYPSI